MSALESSVTLDDVFVVVSARRVPLAPELAGYLALEIAEGAQEPAGDVDPRSVYIGEEGSVALVTRPRREGQVGDAESSVRAILGRLLDASGSQTPSLGSVARRKTAGGLAPLVEELEAALIPVNRAAGRRALARLAREVKRVTLGVGRNASLAPGEPAPKRGSSPSHGALRDAPPSRGAIEPGDDAPAAVRHFEDQPVTARKEAPREILASAVPSSPSLPAEPPASPPQHAPPDASELPTIELRKEQLTAAFSSASSPAPPPAAPAPEPPAPKRPTVDEVDHLLASFAVSSRSEQAQRNELKALVGLEPTPPPPGSYAQREAARPAPHDSDVESLLSLSDGGARVAPGPPSPPRQGAALASPPTAISPQLANEPYGPPAPAAAPSAPALASGPTNAYRDPTRSVPTAPSARKLAAISSFHEPYAPRASRTLAMVALVILGAGAAAVYVLKPSFLSGRSEPPPPVPAAPSAAMVAAAPQAPRCHASLVVTNAPSNAEILLRIGQAPVDVERMPVGARLEFVATAEGFAPKRAIVPSGATWDTGSDGKPRYEIAAQLDKSRARPGTTDNWPSGEPGSEVGGKGSPGTVHLVTTPRGAEVWLLAGLGPDARIEELKCGGDVEVLVAGPTTLRKRLHVPESAFVSLDGGENREATVSASAK